MTPPPVRSASGASVVVTGGGSGIGAAVCRRLSADGAAVWVLDRRGGSAEAVATEVGGRALAVDVADAEAVAEAIGEVAATTGLTGLVNNAGVGNLKHLETYTPAEVDLIWKVNVAGTFNCLRAAAGPLRDAAAAGAPAAVVNVASVSGLRPTRGEAPYSAAKAAVVALTQSAALEWAPEVRVNCVSPGFIRTPLNESIAGEDDLRGGVERRTPAGRLGRPEEVADVVAFLLSGQAGYMTGQNTVLDGGSMLTNAQMDPVFGALLGERPSASH